MHWEWKFWAPGESPEYRRHVRAAKAAGRRGDPDPSVSTQAPACFDTAVGWVEDIAAHAVAERQQALAPDIIYLLSHVDVLRNGLRLVDGGEVGLALERRQRREAGEIARFRALRTKLATVGLSMSAHSAEMASMQALWKRLDADMRQAYRAKHPDADDIQRVLFPRLDLSAEVYLDLGQLYLFRVLGWLDETRKPPTGWAA